ncbi:MAG: patatin-like phospholipase family protein [Pseudomonadales bacterium]
MVKRVLALDASGVRVLATARFLARLEAELPQPLHSTFDLVVGISSGAALACALGVLRLPARDSADLFSPQKLREIYDRTAWERPGDLIQRTPRYDGKRKRRALKQFFRDSYLSDASTPTILITYDVEARRPLLLSNKGKKRIRTFDAADAASALPLFFPTARVNNRWLIDASPICGSATLSAYAEAKSLWPDEEIRLLSVGSGHGTRAIPGKQSRSFGVLGWIDHDLLGIAMDTTLVERQARQLLGKQYVRVNSELADVKDELDDTSRQNLQALSNLADRWFDEFAQSAVALVG